MSRGVRISKAVFRNLAGWVGKHPWLPLIGALLAIKLVTAAAWKVVQTLLAMIAYVLLVITGVAFFRSIRHQDRRGVRLIDRK